MQLYTCSNACFQWDLLAVPSYRKHRKYVQLKMTWCRLCICVCIFLYRKITWTAQYSIQTLNTMCFYSKQFYSIDWTLPWHTYYRIETFTSDLFGAALVPLSSCLDLSIIIPHITFEISSMEYNSCPIYTYSGQKIGVWNESEPSRNTSNEIKLYTIYREPSEKWSMKIYVDNFRKKSHSNTLK